jgi:polysaccharide biosynthesis protein PslF
MRVLVISSTLPPIRSGGADYALRLCERLADHHINVGIVSSIGVDSLTDSRVTLYPVMCQWSWLELPKLLRIARGFRPDVINLHFAGNIYNHEPMITFALSIIKRLIPGIRVVTHIEYPLGIAYHKTSVVSRAIRKLVALALGKHNVCYEFGAILRDSDRIVVFSGTHPVIMREYLSDVQHKCALIPVPPLVRISSDRDGVTRQHGRESLKLSPDDVLIAYFGYVYPGKGVETLFRAFQLVSSQNNKARLLLIGGSNEVLLREISQPHYCQDLAKLGEELGIADKITWSGYYPSASEYPSILLRSADVCVLPFDNGLYLNNSSFATAAGHGLPIISTKADIIETPFVDGHNLLLCPPKDPAAIAAAIDLLIANPELRRQVSGGALKLSSEWFSWDTCIQRTIAVFEGAI